MSAPISLSAENSPARSGFTITSFASTSEPSTSSAATSGKAAEDGSAGTSTWVGVNSHSPVTRTAWMPCGPSSTATSQPKARSMFSVWSRVRTGSSTVVCPGADSPASSTADFTWAEATGSV